MPAFHTSVRLHELVERLVVDSQQPGLLEVRRGDPPATLQVAVEAVAEDVAQGSSVSSLAPRTALRVAGVQLERQGQRVEDPPAARRGAGPPPRRWPLPGAAPTQQADLDEVVEVPGLQRSVLAVVGEAEELARCCGSDSSARSSRTADSPRIVVALVRPPAPSEVSLPKSAPACRCRRRRSARQNRNGAGMNDTRGRRLLGRSYRRTAAARTCVVAP